MSLPYAPNNTCDIYRQGNSPPSAPDVAGVPIFLKPDWLRGQEAGDRGDNTLTWTHIMLADAGVDVRDYYGGGSAGSPQDQLYIPDRNGTRFQVIFIERIGVGTALNHKRVYLDRNTPNWPTDNI
jgi:hypothetical protein